MGLDFLFKMEDKILESLFLDTHLWADVIEHGVRKGVPQRYLEIIQSPRGRADICRRIAYGQYEIEPPRTGYKPKEDGGERVFFANSPQDRLLLHAICKWLTRNEGQMIHPACLSYQEGIGIGKIVKDFSRRIVSLSGQNKDAVVGRKFDIHKYFESIDRQCIHDALNQVEQHHGRSCILDLLHKYYDSDIYYDSRQQCLLESYAGIKQGCAVSSWLANVILYDLDEEVSHLPGLYIRYSDDIIYVGTEYQEATEIIKKHLHRVGLILNEKKQEDITSNRFVRFLGYNIRGGEITLSQKWVKEFQHQIDRLTVKNTRLVHEIRNLRKKREMQAEKEVQRISQRVQKRISRYLYYGDGQYAWTSHVLGIVNRKDDIKQMTLYCLDAIRAMYTGKTSIGGLGVSLQHGIIRGKGRHVTSNRAATSKLEREGWLNNFLSLEAMRQSISNKWLFRTLVSDVLADGRDALYHAQSERKTSLMDDSNTEKLVALFCNYRNSRPDGRTLDRFHARNLSEMNTIDMLCGGNRRMARKELEEYLHENVSFMDLCLDNKSWFWQCPDHPEFVLLKKWFDN